MSVPALEMKVLRPLISQPPSLALGPRADAAGVGAGVGLGQPERTERPPLGQRAQPPLALRVVAEEEQRQRADRHVRLPGGGHRLVGQPDLLHGGDEADGRHADPAPLLGDQHAEQAELAHLAEEVGRAARLLPGRRARARAISFCAKSRQRADQVALGSLREKSTPPSYGLTGTTPVHWCRCRQTASRTPSREFDSVEEERRHRKQRLAAAFRLFGQLRLRRGHRRATSPHATPSCSTTSGSTRSA